MKIKDQSRFFASSDKDSTVSADALLYAKQDPSKVMPKLQDEIGRANNMTDLSMAIGINEDSDSSDDEARGEPQKNHVGSRSSRSAATAQMLSAISQQRLQLDDLTHASSSFSMAQSSETSGLSAAIWTDSL